MIEVGIWMGWDWIIGFDGLFVGMIGFGVSVFYKVFYEYFGIIKEVVVVVVKEKFGV